MGMTVVPSLARSEKFPVAIYAPVPAGAAAAISPAIMAIFLVPML